MVTMGRAAAQVAAVFMARAAVQIPTFKALKEIKVAIISNLAREFGNNNSNLDTRGIQSS